MPGSSGWVAQLARTTAPRATILIRLSVGMVFLSEGLQKFLFAEALGVGRFAKIGIPWPDVLAPFVGVVEIVGGLLLVLGIATRLVAVPLVIDMIVAVLSTKLPILLSKGFWAAAHEARTDYLMLLGLVFLGWVGAGPWSVDDHVLARADRGHR